MDRENHTRCWACDSLVIKKRIEKHHTDGRVEDSEVIPLCVLCHDYVDRMPLYNLEVFKEFWVNVSLELEKLPKEFKWTKLLLLKTNKLIRYKYEQESKIM